MLQGGCEAPMHAYMGPVLVIGFIFQLLVDKIAFGRGGHGHSHGASGMMSFLIASEFGETFLQDNDP